MIVAVHCGKERCGGGDRAGDRHHDGAPAAHRRHRPSTEAGPAGIPRQRHNRLASLLFSPLALNALGQGEACGDHPDKTRKPRQRNQGKRLWEQDVEPAQFAYHREH
jgi:hypothetical protein